MQTVVGDAILPTWTVVNVFRLVSVVALLCCIFQMAQMLSNYWHSIVPMRRELTTLGVDVVAPPIWWTFAYHCGVTVIYALIAGGFIQNAYRGSPGNLFTWTAPIVLVTMNVIIQRFSRYYSQLLRRSLRDKRQN